RGMARRRPAARLRDVADIEAAPAGGDRLAAQPLDEGKRLRMSPVSVAPEPHRLPARPALRQADAARETAAGMPADRVRLVGTRAGLCGEQGACRLCLGARARARPEGEHEQEGEKSHSGSVPVRFPAFTQYNRRRPARNCAITGLTPRRCEPVHSVATAIMVGPMKAVALPDSA